MFGLGPRHKKYIRPVIGIFILLLGSVFLLIPFIPLGYILLIIGALYLAPIFPFMRRIISKIKKWDHKNRVKIAEQNMNKVQEKIDDILIDDDKKT